MAVTGHGRNRDTGPLGRLVLKARRPRGGPAARPTHGFWVFRLRRSYRCTPPAPRSGGKRRGPVRYGALASLARSASLPGQRRELGFVFKISISWNEPRERPGALQVSGRVGLRGARGPGRSWRGAPDPGNHRSWEASGRAYELCPGGSGQLPPQAPGLSGCPEHPSRGTASPAGTRGPHFCRGTPAAFPTSSRTRLLVHWAGPGNLGQRSSVTRRGTGADGLHPQGPGRDTHTPKRGGVQDVSGQAAQRPPRAGGWGGGQGGSGAGSLLAPACRCLSRSRLRGAMATAL